jgi:hypothetical protein
MKRQTDTDTDTGTDTGTDTDAGTPAGKPEPQAFLSPFEARPLNLGL